MPSSPGLRTLKTSKTEIIAYGSVTSTMDVARHLFSGPTKHEVPFAVKATEQLSGRGRLNSDWQSRSGNLYTTIVLRPNLKPQTLALSSFAVALALYDCIVENAHAKIDLKVKWPNDLLLGGEKIAGLLLEAVSPDGLLIGLGVNLKHAPKLKDKAYRAADLSKHIDLNPHEFLQAYLVHLEYWMQDLEDNGFQGLRQTWLNRAYGIGQFARVRLAIEETEGTLQGIDQHGQLLLTVTSKDGQQSETRAIAAGSVFL